MLSFDNAILTPDENTAENSRKSTVMHKEMRSLITPLMIKPKPSSVSKLF